MLYLKIIIQIKLSCLKKRLFAFVIYALFWLFFFIVARGIFLLMQFRELITYSPGTILDTFTHGFKLDLSATCYVLAIPLLISLPGLFFSGMDRSPGKYFLY